MAKIRFCEKIKNGKVFYPCDFGWGILNCKPDGTSEAKGCHDEPMEENCNHLIEDDELMFGMIS
jgi:hypothetical protein